MSTGRLAFVRQTIVGAGYNHFPVGGSTTLRGQEFHSAAERFGIYLKTCPARLFQEMHGVGGSPPIFELRARPHAHSAIEELL
ncbi:hypothetical protein D3C87_2092680 [compost metagenome]